MTKFYLGYWILQQGVVYDMVDSMMTCLCSCILIQLDCFFIDNGAMEK